MLRFLLVGLACFVGHTARPPAAQTRPAAPLVFDDFAYGTREALFAPARWTDIDGRGPACSSGVAPRTGCERLWYSGNWMDEGAPGRRIDVDGASSVRLQSFPGDFNGWSPGEMTPTWLMAGFVAPTGTWAASVRLDDIRTPQAHAGGPGTAPFLTDAFWVASVHYASRTDRFDRAHSSEINHEWNNYFYTPRRIADRHDTALRIDAFVSSAVTFDGECQGNCFNGVASGGFFMANPRRAGAAALTCTRTQGGVTEDVADPLACQASFVSDGDPGRSAAFLIQYDGFDLTWAAETVDAGGAGTADDVTHRMAHTVRFGRRMQPMAAVFSQIIAGRGFCASADPPVPQSACTADRARGFSADWFLYTPDTDVSLGTVGRWASWLRARGRTRVNTTGLRLAPPTAAPGPASARLETPATAARGARLEWTVTPPLPWQHAGYTNTSWNVEWHARGRRTARSAWTSWQPVEEGGFSIEAPFPSGFERVEVEVRVTDWHPGPHSAPATLCRGVVRGRTEYVCTGRR